MSDNLDLAVLKKFRRLFRTVNQQYQAQEERCGVSSSQFWVLSCLQKNGMMRVSELAAALAIHQSTASNLIERMVNDGLLMRSKSDQDQRVTFISLSEKGLSLIEKADLSGEGTLQYVLHHLSPEELAQISSALDILMSKLGGVFF